MTRADPCHEQVERVHEIFRGGSREPVPEGDIAAQHHAGASQPHGEAEAIPSAGQHHTLQRERHEGGCRHGSSVETALAAGLRRGCTLRDDTRALVEEVTLDQRIGVDHHDRVPLEAACVVEPGLTGGSPARSFVRSSLEDDGAVGAGDLSGRIGAAVGHDEHLVVGMRGTAERCKRRCQDSFLVVGRHQHEQARPWTALTMGFAL